jgi:hypothetical protein
MANGKNLEVLFKRRLSVAKKEFVLTWTLEAFDGQPSFYTKRMFGGLAVYVYGRMVMILTETAGERGYRGKSYSIDLWDGILLAVERDVHSSLMNEFPSLLPHPVLGKWLYLPQTADDFEDVALEIAQGIAQNDQRYGILPKPNSANKKKM